MKAIEQILANPIVAQFLGLIVGLFTSFFSWWVLFRWLTPSIALSDSICKSTNVVVSTDGVERTETTYKLQFKNDGYRTIIDFQVRALIRIKGLVNPESSTWRVAHIVMLEDGGKTYFYPNVAPFRRSKIRWTLPLHINRIESFRTSPYPADIRAKAEAKSLLLEDLLSLGTAAEVRVIESGYDEFSGARKMYERTYHLDDVKVWKFKKGEVVKELETMGDTDATGADTDGNPGSSMEANGK
jgi:hypothetical protein